MPAPLKGDLFRTIAEHSPNAIFLLGDLLQNSSYANLHGFNFLANGPKNAGNLDIRDEATQANYILRDVAFYDSPAGFGLHPKQLETVCAEARNDGWLIYAYRGPVMRRILEAA